MLQPDTMGFTDIAMQGSRGLYMQDANLVVRFLMLPYRNDAKTATEGRPIFEELAFVEIMQPGNKESVLCRPARQQDKERFHEQWRRFEAREDQSGCEGTPLTEWPGITRAQCEELRFLNVRSVEQLVGMSDSNAQNIMGIHSLKQRASEWMEAAKTQATATALAAANSEIEELKKAVAKLLEKQNDEIALHTVAVEPTKETAKGKG